MPAALASLVHSASGLVAPFSLSTNTIQWLNYINYRRYKEKDIKKFPENSENL